MRFKPTPGMALAVSLLALVIATTGTAVAAKSMLTGKDIKNGSITSADIAKGAIKSKHLGKASVKGENIADNAVTERELGPVPMICPNGIVIYDRYCPSLPRSYASAENVAFDIHLPQGPGQTCHAVTVPFTDGFYGSDNTWRVEKPRQFRMAGVGGGATMTVSVVFGNTQDTIVVAAGLNRKNYTDSGGEVGTINVPGALTRMAPSPAGDTGLTLSYHFTDLAPQNVVEVQVVGCSTGAVPTIKSVNAFLANDLR